MKTIFLFLLMLVIAYETTAYNPKLKLKKYIKIKNPKLAKLFITSSDPVLRRKNNKNNRDKILISGIISYILTILTIMMCILYNNYEFTYSITFLLAGCEILFVMINSFTYGIENSKHKKFTKFITIFSIVGLSLGLLLLLIDVISIIL